MGQVMNVNGTKALFRLYTVADVIMQDYLNCIMLFKISDIKVH